MSVAAPNPVSVGAGQTAGGVDITVGARGAVNAQLLGLHDVAQNTGAAVNRGSVNEVILFGPGLSGDMQVSVSGRGDITVSDVHSIESTDGTPGIAFTATVAADATPGARTVVLVSSRGVTTFTGGLGVLP